MVNGVKEVRTGPGEKVAVYFATRALYDLLPAAYGSMTARGGADRIVLMIEDDGLPFDLPEGVECVNVSGQTFFPKDGANYLTPYTYMVLMKMTVPKLFPGLDRALVIDVDTIVCGDLTGLWEMDLGTAYYAAVTEKVMSRKKGRPYANAGVLMLNCGRLRESGMCDALIADLNENRHEYAEQDALHELCGEDFLELGQEWNWSKVTKRSEQPPTDVKVIHYAGERTWWRSELVQDWLLRMDPAWKAAVYIGNRKVYGMMRDAAKSLLDHSPVDRVYFLTEDDEFPERLPEVIRCINVSGQTWFDESGPNYHPYYSCMTTLRAALTKLLPGENRALLLDPDTVVTDDISGIWNYDVREHYFAAVQEVRNHNHRKAPYYNAGVMLMNLKKMREDRMDEALISEINRRKYEHLEQDVMNILCDGKILDLPPMYNASFVSEPCTYPKIMHFLDRAKRFFPEAVAPYAGKEWGEIRFAGGGMG